MKEAAHIVSDWTAQLEAYEIAAQGLFGSTKAMVEGRLSAHCGVLPPQVVLGRDILSAQDQQGIEDALHAAVDARYHPGMRTCFAPQIPNSPWVMGIKSHDDVERFMAQKYPQWRHLPDISEIIVMHNFPGLDPNSKELHKQHFVFRLWPSDSSISLEARLGTTQLRDLEAGTDRSDMILAKVDRATVGFKSIKFDFGANYAIDGQKDEWQVSQVDFWRSYHVNGRVRPQAIRTIDGVIRQVQLLFVDPYIRLGSRLEAFANRGLEISEWQGRFDEAGQVVWMRIYGFRGSKDETHWTQNRLSRS
jgi:hypothetical protein